MEVESRPGNCLSQSIDFFALLGAFVLVSLGCYNELSKKILLINNILGGWEESEIEVLAGQDLTKASFWLHGPLSS